MRLRITMIFAICTLLLVMIPGYSTTQNAISSIFWGMLGAFVVGILGFFIGGILTQPHGNSHNKWPRFFKGLFTIPSLDDTPISEPEIIKPVLNTNTSSEPAKPEAEKEAV